MPDRTIRKIMNFDTRLAKLIDKMLAVGKPPELISAFANNELKLLTKQLGIDSIMDEYTNNLLKHAIRGAGKVTKNQAQTLRIAIDTLANSYKRRLSTAIDSNLAQIETEMLSGLMSTVPKKALRNRFRLSYGGVSPKILSDNNINTIINTSYANIDRILTAQKYAKDKTKRFHYTGGLVERSSKQCTHLFTTQRKNGYTMAQIHSGIQTPYGIIDWMGRIPNYNCIHSWK